MDDFPVFITGILFSAILFIGIPLLAIRQIDRKMAPNACMRYGQTSNREVKFVQNTFFDYGCYVKTSDGKYLPKDQLREIAE